MSYASEILADSPWLWWRMDETAGTTLADSSGNGRTGTLQGTAFTREASLVPGDPTGGAIDFHATSGSRAISAGFGSALAGGSITLEVTGKTTSLPSSFANYRVLCAVASATASPTQWIRADGGIASRAGALNASADAGSHTAEVAAGDDLTAGSLHHFMFVYDATTGTGTIYRDGASVATVTGPVGGISTSGSATFQLSDIGFTGHEWDGPLQHAVVYKAALSAARVAAHYAAWSTELTVVPAAMTAARSARGFTAAAGIVTTVPAAMTAARSRGFSAAAVSVESTALTASRTRGWSASAGLIKLAAPWTADVSRSWARWTRDFAAAPSMQPEVVPTPDLVLVPGQILTRET